MTSPVRPLDLDAVPAEPVPVVLALGTNLGDRLATLRSALAQLRALDVLSDVVPSGVYETPPVGGPDQPAYLNAVVRGRARTSPRGLLRATQSVEHAHGRERTVRWGPRTLDVDLIVFGDLVSSDRELTLPHPRAHERGFVLVPWVEVEPDALLPGPDGGRVADLAARAADTPDVRRLPDVDLEGAA